MTLERLLRTNHKRTNFFAKTAKVKEVKFYSSFKNLLVFMVYGSQSYSNPNGHLASILLKPIPSKKSKGKIRNTKVLETPCRVYCTCPAYVYWGSEYNATKGNYNYETSQDIEPNIRDPQRERKICKHLASTQKVLKRLTIRQARKKFMTAMDNESISFRHPDVQAVLKRLGVGEIDSDRDFDNFIMCHLIDPNEDLL